MATTVSIALNGLTFGDLYDFADLARSAGVTRETEVHQEFDNDGQDGPFTLEVVLDNLAEVRRANLGIDREEFLQVLNGMIDSGGDARYVLDELTKVRDHLVSQIDGQPS
jgi:hypothetical protein